MLLEAFLSLSLKPSLCTFIGLAPVPNTVLHLHVTLKVLNFSSVNIITGAHNNKLLSIISKIYFYDYFLNRKAIKTPT